MAKQDCRIALLNTGLFGSGDDALEQIDAVLNTIVADKRNYDASGKVDIAQVNQNMAETIRDLRIAKRKEAVKSYKTLEAFRSNKEKFDLWQAEYKAQAGKDIPITRMFQSLLVGWNGRETLTGGKLSVETISAHHSVNYMRDLTDGLEMVIEKHGDHLKPLLGVQDNIFKDTYRGIKNSIDGDLTAARRDFNLSVMRAMEGGDVKDPIAREVASVLTSMYKKIAEDINRAGGNINITENYHPHSHNAEAMLAAGKATWKQDIRNRIDWAKTYPEAYNLHAATMEKLGESQKFADTDFADEFLENVYYNVTTGTRNEFSFNESRGKFSTRASRKFERARTIAFASPDDYAEYANRFSTVDAISVAILKIRQASNMRGAMELLGPVPEDTLNMLKKSAELDLRNAGKAGQLTDNQIASQLESLRFDPVAGTGFIGKMHHSVMGYSDMAVNANVAKFFGAWRMLNRMKLGAMNIAALFGDMITGTVQAKRVKGTPNNLFEVLYTAANRLDWRDKNMVDALALDADEFFGAVYNRFDSPESLIENKRLLNRFQSAALRWTGTGWLTDAARASSQKVHMRALASHKGKAWGDLHPDVRHDMAQSGIKSVEWDIIRKHAAEVADSGREYVLPRNIQKVSNKDIDALIPEKFHEKNRPAENVSEWTSGRDEARAQARDNLEARLKQYFIVGDRYAVIQMGARAKFWATGMGSKKGTFAGELGRTVGQFKMQPIEASNLIFREGRAGSTAGGIHTVVSHLGFIGTSMLMGYAMMTSKDLVGNRTPRDISTSKTWLEAMSYSGGMGFVWDTITNDIQTYGNPFAIFGPVAGDLGEGFSAVLDVNKVMTGEMTLEEYGKKFGSRAYKTVKGWIPRLWFMRTLMDYYLFNPLEEEMNPGINRRRQQKMKRNTGQEYLLGQPAHDWS